jgi:hypothetical protein
VLGNARLRGIFPLRRTGKRPFFTNRNDGADLPQRDIGHETPENPGIRKSNASAQNILFLLSLPTGLEF